MRKKAHRHTGCRRWEIPSRVFYPLYAVVLLLACFLFLAACSFEYEKTQEGDSGTVADFILTDTSYSIRRSGEHTIEFTAKTLEMFDADHKAVLSLVQFRQVTDGGEIVSSGKCDTAEIDTIGSDAALEGNIEIRSDSENATLQAGTLLWDNSIQVLSSGNNAIITIDYDDGSRICGTGFHGDFTLNSFEFQEILEGRMRYE